MPEEERFLQLSAAETLRSWGDVPEDNIDLIVELLRSSKDPAELRAGSVAKHLGSGLEQFLIPLFRHLYPTLREEVLKELGDHGLSSELVEEYFESNSGMLVLTLNHPEIRTALKPEQAEAFKLAVAQIMIDKLKEHLNLR
jgi:hypothetical protein